MDKVQDKKQGQDKAELSKELQGHENDNHISVSANVKPHDSGVVQQSKEIVYSTQNLDLWYGDNHALKNINLDILENNVTAIIGPSGCGKSTYIKTLNRMVELVPVVKTAGKILYLSLIHI